MQNCPICAREQDVAMRPVVTGGELRHVEPQRPEPRERSPRTAGTARRTGSGQRGRMRVRQLERAADDGYASALIPGVRSIADAERLAQELAFATARLQVLELAPPGLYAEVADPAGDLEERTWLAFLIAFLSPLDDDQPFAAIEAVRVPWAGGGTPELADGTAGPRGVDPARGQRTIEAYRAWAQRGGSQAAAIAGDDGWTPERRFDRGFERLGSQVRLERDPRYDLLVTLGRLGVYELDPAQLHVGGSDRVTLAAKRLLGIGDPLLLQRRALELAQACEVPFAALDLAFFNWERGARTAGGIDPETEPDPGALSSARAALSLS